MTDAPERVWAWHWEVDRHRGQWTEEQEIVGEGTEYIRADIAADLSRAAVTAAYARAAGVCFRTIDCGCKPCYGHGEARAMLDAAGDEILALADTPAGPDPRVAHLTRDDLDEIFQQSKALARSLRLTDNDTPWIGKIAAAIADTPAPHGSPGWQPIETAPTNRFGFLAAIIEEGATEPSQIEWLCGPVGADGKRWNNSSGNRTAFPATHWAPLPGMAEADPDPHGVAHCRCFR